VTGAFASLGGGVAGLGRDIWDRLKRKHAPAEQGSSPTESNPPVEPETLVAGSGGPPRPGEGGSPGQPFLSYPRSDADAHARLLFERLMTVLRQSELEFAHIRDSYLGIKVRSWLL